MVLNLLTLDILRLCYVNDDVIVHIYAWDGGVDIIFYMSMCMISVDRLLYMVLHVRYNYYVTEKVVKSIIVLFWIIGTVLALPFHFLDASYTYTFFYHYLYQVCDPICVAVAIICYSVIAYKLNRARKTHVQPAIVSQSRDKDAGAVNIKIYYIPSCIIITFVLFYFLPDIFLTTYSNNKDVQKFIPFMWSIGLLTDPLVYVFLDKQCRACAVQLLRCKRESIFVLHSDRNQESAK